MATEEDGPADSGSDSRHANPESLAVWTRSDTTKGKIWPFLVLKKLDQIVGHNNRVDEESAWRPRLTAPAAQQAAVRIEDRESARLERLEDKLDRQQPIAALLVPVAAALLSAAWLNGYGPIAVTAGLALGAAGIALLTAASANVPFHHHTLTVPEVEQIVDGDGDIGVEIAARALTDSQRNIPRGISIQNRIAAVRHALLTSLALIVLSALFFAIPNWDTAEDPEIAHARIQTDLTNLAHQVSAINKALDGASRGQRQVSRDLARIERSIQGIKDRIPNKP